MEVQSDSASNMVNSRQRKRRIRMNEMTMERGTKMFEGERRAHIEVVIYTYSI